MPPSFLPITQGSNENMKVAELIQEPGKWNTELIQQLYLVPDSQIIEAIPLSPFDHPDSWQWHYTRNGNYTVKSGYNLALNSSKSGPSSSSDAISSWWKAYWAIKIPKKILIFAWRGYHEILPTTNGLYRRNVFNHSNCPLCGFGKDSNAHAVFWCPFSQKLWTLMDYPFLMGHKEEISFKDVLLYATELLETEEFAKMLITTWGIWNERNKITHGQQKRTPQQLKCWLSMFYEEIKNVHESVAHTGGELTHGDHVEREIHDLALFVDASVSTPSHRVGLGAVILTANKRVEATLSKPLAGNFSVLNAEALALLVGLRWAQVIGLPIKIISTDSLSLVQALNNKDEYHNELGIFLSDINALLSNFPGASISHVRREFNIVAHNLAKNALQLEDEVLWMREIPH